MHKSLHLLAIYCILLYGCSKNNPNPQNTNNNIVKINLVSGNNQTSGVGNPLNDSIVVKVLNNSSPLANCAVQFTGSGCNDDLTTELHTGADGTVKYLWRLAANQGSQTLKIVAVNSGKRADSVNASATATSAAGMLRMSACTPNPGSNAESICRLSTGRLLACFAAKTSIRYSDDNGLSWNPVKGFGANHSVALIATSPQDEIFAATIGEGVFYSKDGGSTWTNITPPAFNPDDIIDDIAYTTNGKLIFTGLSKDIFISPDKGKTWTSSDNGLSTSYAYRSPVEQKNGDLYILAFGDVLYKSTDGGTNWVAQNNTSTEHITAVYVDANDWLYKATLASDGGIYVSKDHGTSFTQVIPLNNTLIVNMSTQQDGNFYFGQLAYAIYRVNNNNPITPYIYTDDAYPVYVVTPNNGMVYVKNGGIFY
ncbi:MAG: hypothetical protein ACXVB0_11595 [Mucilaginibacter sp.]